MMILPITAHAVVIEGLYGAEVFVSEKNSRSRGPALQKALHQVLVKLGVQNGLIDDLIHNAPAFESLLQNYGYQQAKLSDEGNWLLKVNFDPSALNSLLKHHQVKVWGSNRPLLLVWLAVERDGVRELLREDADEGALNLSAAINESLGKYSVPFIIPVLDLADQSAVAVSDVWGLFDEPLKASANRYRADAVLAGRLYQHMDGRWLADWSLITASNKTGWQTQGFDVQSIISKMSDNVANHLVADYGVSPGEKERFILQINGVNSVQNYAAVIKYIQALGLKKINVRQVSKNTMTLTAEVSGGKPLLLQTLKLGDTLSVLPAITTLENPMVLALQYHATS
jgi:hypothetical protein